MARTKTASSARFAVEILAVVLVARTSNAFGLGRTAAPARTTCLTAGPFEFLRGQGGSEFVKVGGKDDQPAFGPPVILLGGFPVTIADEELSDMVSDTAAQAWKQGLSVVRVKGAMFDQTLAEALVDAVGTSGVRCASGIEPGLETPVILFSGISNGDIKEISRLLLSELFAETGQRAAIAKAVPPAMGKEIRQLFDEIGGDHRDALAQATARR